MTKKQPTTNRIKKAYPNHIQSFSPLTIGLAKMLSILFNPLLILPYGYLLVIWASPYQFGVPSFEFFWSSELHRNIFQFLIIYILVIPICGMVIMRQLGVVKSLRRMDRMDRIGPYILTGAFYIAAYMSLPMDEVPPVIKLFILGATIALFIAFLVNLFSKVSIHSVGMGILLAAALLIDRQAGQILQNAYGIGGFFLSGHLLLLTVVVCGFVGSARRILSNHLPADIYGGYFIGFFSVFIALNFVY